MPINNRLNDRLSTFLTPHEGEIACMQRYHKACFYAGKVSKLPDYRDVSFQDHPHNPEFLQFPCSIEQ